VTVVAAIAVAIVSFVKNVDALMRGSGPAWYCWIRWGLNAMIHKEESPVSRIMHRAMGG
jgi:hypothetical protein